MISTRLAALKLAQTAKPEIMYTAIGAEFQEYCLANLDNRGSAAHKMIGSLVTMINNNRISVSDAKTAFNSAKAN